MATYLRVEVADVHGPPDLIDFGRVHVAHEGRLGRGRGRDVQAGGHPVHYGEVQLKKTPVCSQRALYNPCDFFPPDSIFMILIFLEMSISVLIF